LLEVKEKLLDEMDAAQTDGHESRWKKQNILK
jgi:hypothetical protein